MNIDLVNEITKKYPYISNPTSHKICGGILCISCYINNSANYFILYPGGQIKYKQFDEWEYTSNFNKEGSGNGLVFIDLSTQELIITFYFKDDLNFDYPIDLTDSSEAFIIAEHEERTHIIYLDDFTIHSFGGTEYKCHYPYVLFMPYSGYSSYDTFSLVNIDSKKRVDLNERLQSIIENDVYRHDIGWFHEESIFLDLNSKSLMYQYQHSSELFKIDIDKLFSEQPIIPQFEIKESKIQHHSAIEINGKWDKGLCLDVHTIKSSINSDGSFNTIRSEIGQLLYELKYRFKRENIDVLSNIICKYFNNNLSYFTPSVDVIIPISPSNQHRPFQPLQELCKSVSSKLGIKCDLDYLTKDSSVQIKEIANSESRESILEKSFKISGLKYKGKAILLFDDLFRSGDTLNAATQLLRQKGQVEYVYVLTVTKTRVKR